ncbi:hypothetical protein UlMin_000765 [Ulmus minor]
MTATLECISGLNPNPNPSSASSSTLKKPMAFYSSPSSLRFNPLLRNHTSRVSIALAKGLSSASISLRRPSSWNRPLVVFAASQEDSKHSEIEVEKEKGNLGEKESQEAWKEALASFKEQALKVQSVSQEAYEIYSKKALVILKETSEQLKIQADKARIDLNQVAQEISEEGKEYLSTAAENSPETVKEIVETITSSDDFSDMSRVTDYRVGIPYGLVLSLGGFLSFMVTGSLSAIRFGVILGSTLLILGISSLRSYKAGKPSSLALKGQAAVASIIFLRELRLLGQRASLPSVLTTFVSGAVVAFYIYKIAGNRRQNKGSQFGEKAEN